MKRKEFILYSAGAIAGGTAITLLLDACKKTTDTSASGPATDFTIDLNDPANAALKTNGGFVYKNSIIIARDSGGNYLAIYSVCTHQGCAIQFDGSSSFPCPCHGARFDKNGNVTNGPANKALRKYNTSLSGTALRIFS